MDLSDFKKSLRAEEPPNNLSPNLKSLWYDARGEWHQAHDLADGSNFPEADWVHAYLHRKEGDNWNANYWYRRAGKSMPSISLEEEWQQLVTYFLEK